MFKVIQTKVFDFVNIKKINDELVKTFIVYKNSDGNYEPHLLSKYIDINFGNTELNTQKKYAEEVKKFLNYILSKKGLFDLSSLSLKHGADYLRYLSYKVQKKEISKGTFFYTEKRLIHFYMWLSSNKLITEDIKVSTKHNRSNRGSEITISPFKRLDLGVPYPKNNKTVPNRLHDFGHERKKYIALFLNFVEIYSPEILIGVMLQFFGGIRPGEVVNIKIKNVLLREHATRQPITVEIEDNWTESVKLDSQVKKNRQQTVFYLDLLDNSLTKHLKKLDSIGLSKEDSLIVSYRDGTPLSGQRYRYRFNRVRGKFINYIKDKDYHAYLYFTSKHWSAHIGRGVFTNILQFDLNVSDSELRVFRGDESIESLKDYLEKANAYKLADQYIEKLNELLG